MNSPMKRPRIRSNNAGTGADSKVLFGWKSIANYLGMGVRTIQRYERDHGFPVRRPSGERKGAVIATVAEVDAWVAATPVREYFKLATPKLPTSTFAELQAGVQRMRELCVEMRQFRTEIKLSMDALHSTIHGTARTSTHQPAESEFRPNSPTAGRRPN